MKIRYVRHAVGCATGARAEQRAECDCGAESQEAAWEIEILKELDTAGHSKVSVVTAAVMTSGEAVSLSIALADITRECGRLFAIRDERKGKRSSR